jgi:hypothetical protein
VERERYLAAYLSTATYQLMVSGDLNETHVAHAVEADGVDRFQVNVGFAPSEVGYLFTAEVTLRFNGEREAVSKPVHFDSCLG